MRSPLSAGYSPVLLPEHPGERDLQRLVEPYQAMIVTQFRAILDRSERSGNRPWIDTKIDLITGQDFDAADPLLARDLVSGWVQGRGLEAIVGFGRWLQPYAADPEAAAVVAQVRRVAAGLLARLRAARALNGGHLHFYMTAEGQALQFDAAGRRRLLQLSPSSPYGFSDMFSAKGMYAAAHFLGDTAAQSEARAYCRDVYQAILAQSFISDQPVPETVAKGWVPGAYPHGPYMIGQSMAALLAEFEPGPESTAMGLRLAQYVLDHHVNLAGRWPQFRELDMVEYLDADGNPHMENGQVVSDPGHALEYAGLFLKLSQVLRRHGGADQAQLGQLERIERLMPAFIQHQFANGYRAAGGITKTIDLLTRQPIDDTMPWWSLPETIRAGLECWRLAPGEAAHQGCLDVVARSHNAFVRGYVRPAIHLMAVKLLDGAGQVVDLLPAYPDVDPGYHTALSLIDALAAIAG